MLDARYIGAKIADYRKKRNLTQIELAQHIHMTPQAVSKWETGKSLPDIFTFIKLAKVLQIDLSVLLGENKELTGDILYQLSPQEVLDRTLLELHDILPYASVVKPDQWQHILQKEEIEALTTADIIELSPLIDEETLMTIVHTHMQSLIADKEALTALAPFLNEETLYAIVCGEAPITMVHIVDIIQLAPYYTDKLNQYITEHPSEITIPQLSSVAPFIESAQLMQFLHTHWDHYEDVSCLVEQLALLPKDMMTKLLIEHQISYELLMVVIPLVEPAFAQRLVERYSESLDSEQLATLQLMTKMNWL